MPSPLLLPPPSLLFSSLLISFPSTWEKFQVLDLEKIRQTLDVTNAFDGFYIMRKSTYSHQGRLFKDYISHPPFKAGIVWIRGAAQICENCKNLFACECKQHTCTKMLTLDLLHFHKRCYIWHRHWLFGWVSQIASLTLILWNVCGWILRNPVELSFVN